MGTKLLVVVSTVALLGAACGGGGAAGHETKDAKSAAKSPDDGESSGTEEREVEVDPRKAACADGTCFECGTGVCPKGFYCDEKAPGGAACAWLPECAASPSCSCVSRALDGCGCEERSGGVFASCK